MAPNNTGGIVIKPIGQMVAAMQRYGEQLFNAPKDTIRGIEADSWYSPLQPVKPIAPEGTEPRGFQYWAGQNLLWTPRADAEFSAADLKQLATYPLARICMENVKDSLARIPWEIQLRRQPGETKKAAAERAKGNPELIKLNRFFEYPDREHNWSEWLRPLIDDMLVIDAASILIRKTFKDEIAELAVLRGDSIVRYIDVNGFTPMPPQPAYAQNWWGVPLVNLSTDQLLYKPRNIVPRNTVSSQLYGMSPTEQLATEIQIGMQRLQFTLNYYTEGSTPGVVQVVPRGVSTGKIQEAMEWMNSELSGNLAARRQWRLVQGWSDNPKDENIMFTKEPLLADAFDEMHIRKICFGYGTSPQRLMRMMNRASAQQADESAEIEGLLPWINWMKGVMDILIRRKFGRDECEMIFNPFQEPDSKKEADRVTTLTSKAVITLNQGREILGEEPMDVPEADQLGIVTGTGWVPIGADHQLEQQQTLGTDAESEHKRNIDKLKNTPAPTGGPGGTSSSSKSNGKGPEGAGSKVSRTSAVSQRGLNSKPNGTAEPHAHYGFGAALDTPEIQAPIPPTLTKRTHRAVVHPSVREPQSILAQRRLELVMHNHLHHAGTRVIDELQKALRLKKLRNGRLAKAEPLDRATKKILDELAAEWDTVPDEIEPLLEQAALAGAAKGSLQVDVTDAGIMARTNKVVQKWARDRAAELVGMRRAGDGSLFPNPIARWAISETTRDDLRAVIQDIFGMKEPTLRDVEERVWDAGIFSDTRASMIARTEISLAQTNGNLEAWKQSGKVETVEWVLSGDHDQDDVCNENEGTWALDEAPDLPAHPNCECSLVLGDITVEEG